MAAYDGQCTHRFIARDGLCMGCGGQFAAPTPHPEFERGVAEGRRLATAEIVAKLRAMQEVNERIGRLGAGGRGFDYAVALKMAADGLEAGL